MTNGTILVTGGAGYVGSHFIKTALGMDSKLRVVVVDDLRTGHPEALDSFDRAVLKKLDLSAVEQVSAVLREYDVQAVVHFAASCYVGESQVAVGKYWKNNVANSIALFQAMEIASVRTIVFSSSCAVYGRPAQVPITESCERNPINVYGATKKTVEDVLHTYSDRLGWRVACLRYFNAAGADLDARIGESHAPETHAIPLLLQAAKGERPHFEVFGNDYDTPDGTCIRDYVHVNDLARAHCLALDVIEAGGGFHAINLGSEVGTSVQELITAAQAVTNRSFEIRIEPRRSGDPPRLVASAQLARQFLGWRPELSIESIMQSAWDWEQARKF